MSGSRRAWAAIVTIAVVALFASPVHRAAGCPGHGAPPDARRRPGGRADHGAAHHGPGQPAAVLGALCLTPLAGRPGCRGRLLALAPGRAVEQLVGYSASQPGGRASSCCSLWASCTSGCCPGSPRWSSFGRRRRYRGRVRSFFLVALGVAYPIGSLGPGGPIIDWIGLGWTTAGTAVLLTLIAGAS